jgi:hypothetical protein
MKTSLTLGQSDNPKNGSHENNRFHFISALSIESCVKQLKKMKT